MIRWKIRIWLVPVFVLGLPACNGASSSNLSTETHSSEIATEAEQIEFLGRYVTLKSAVSQTEFHIIYNDNSTGPIPGPSDWDIQAVMRVEDVAPWIDGKTVVETADFTWAEGLLADGLRPASQPTYYTNQTTTIAVFEPEQIIYLRSTTTP